MTQPTTQTTQLELNGELHRFAAQLGPTETLPLGVALASLAGRRVDSVRALRDFLRVYREQILVPLEWPAILRAHTHTTRGETRELVAFDRALGKDLRLQEFAAASHGVGRRQLHRLRPLRDQRVVQRYLAAVDEGRAHGWHTLVYGMTLAIYSLPLRQGLQHYAHTTLGGLVNSAASPLALTQAEITTLLDEVCAGLPVEISTTLADAALATAHMTMPPSTASTCPGM